MLEVDLIDHLRIQHNALIARLRTLEAREIGPINFAVVHFGTPGTGTTRSAVEVTQIGIPPEFIDLLQVHVADPINELDLAKGTVGEHVLQGEGDTASRPV